MSYWMIAGILLDIGATMWADYEKSNPSYWASWGVSKRTADVVNIATMLLFPLAYVLILFSPGHSWWFRILALLFTIFVGGPLVSGTLLGVVAGMNARRRLRETIASAAEYRQVHGDDLGPAQEGVAAHERADPTEPPARS